MTKEITQLTLIFLLLSTAAWSQSFRIDDLKNTFGKGKPLKLSGGLSANTTYTSGNGEQGREPFVYYLNGTVDLNLYGLIDLPFTLNLTNSGTSYKLPSIPNRLSLHPSYKWMTAHIGDVSMDFSPYSLNGHLFTGVGLEMKPGTWEFDAMYGRLQKAVAYNDSLPSIMPTYKRMGYGLKLGRKADSYEISVNLLKAKDSPASLAVQPDSLGVTPMDNLAGSVALTLRPLKFIEISGEYGFSWLTTDLRDAAHTKTFYKAIKAQINYVGEHNRFGLGYERVDPGYRSLGAYYFTNDLENITANGSQSLWQDKLKFDLSLGYEHDDLAHTKASASSRVVGSANISFAPNERLNVNLSYSDFQSYSNLRSNFDYINQQNPLDRLDTLDFAQLSQSANLSLSYVLQKTEAQSQDLNLNLSYQDASNKQGGVYQPGSVTEMLNAVAAYSLSFLKTGLKLNGAFNLSDSRILNASTLTLGPTLGASARLLHKKILLNSSLSYNIGEKEGLKQSEVFLFRLNGTYCLKQRHNFTLAYNYQWRSALSQPAMDTSILTAGYSYNF
ncbi:MAG: hypothetical protein LBL81_03065 [Tannerella sp.]|jgi:hypothetical protein|nr:hypothetical protein [Tannerella sp.]